jgi:hypothetical protein
MVVSVWRLVKHIFHCIVCCVVVVWPMHGVIVRSQWSGTQLTLHSTRLSGELHLFYGITHNCWTAIEAEFVNISVSLTCNMVCVQCFSASNSFFCILHSRILLWCRVAYVGNHTSTIPAYKIVVTNGTTG